MPIGAPPPQQQSMPPITQPGHSVKSPLIPMMEAQSQGIFPFVTQGHVSPDILNLLRSAFAQDTASPQAKAPIPVSQSGPDTQVTLEYRDARPTVKIASTDASGISVVSPEYFDERELLAEVDRLNLLREYATKYPESKPLLGRLEERASMLKQGLDILRETGQDITGTIKDKIKKP